MRLTVIGCSGSFPGPGSPASCYLLETEDADGRTWRVLLDLGSGALGPLQQHVPVGELDAVLVSHLHPDHFADLCGLFVALRYDPAGGPTRRVPVYGPPDTLARLEGAYGADEHGSMAEVYDVRAWSDGLQVRLGPLTVTARRVDHPVPAFGLRVEQDGAVLAYTGDSDSCPALTELATGAGLLLAEASFVEGRDTVRGIHLTGQRAGQLAAGAGAAALVLTHIPVWTDPAVVLAEARGAYRGPVAVARPGAVHQVRAPLG